MSEPLPADMIVGQEFPNWMQRVVKEHAELVQNIAKLDAFITSDAFHAASIRQQYLMNRQIAAMQEYAWILNKRIEDFKK